MKTIILFLLISLTFTVNAEENTSNFETEVAPYVDVESLKPSQEDLEHISRLSEKYIDGTISETELNQLEKTGADISNLDKYKNVSGPEIDLKQSDNIGGISEDLSSQEALQKSNLDSSNTSISKSINTGNISLYLILLSILTVVNTFGLIYMCMRKK